MHDPFQSYQTLGAYSGGVSPFGSPYGASQIPSFYHGIPQIPGLNPFAAGLQNPLLQNPMLQNPLLLHQLMQTQWQNPLLGAGSQNPYQAQPQQQFGYPPQQQVGYPQQQQFGYPLAPQTLIGAGAQYGAGGQYGAGQGIPQIHPIALQLALRSLATSGISPWGGY